MLEVVAKVTCMIVDSIWRGFEVTQKIIDTDVTEEDRNVPVRESGMEKKEREFQHEMRA